MIKKVIRGMICFLIGFILVREDEERSNSSYLNTEMIAFFVGIATFSPGISALVAGWVGAVIFLLLLILGNSQEMILASKVSVFLFGMVSRDIFLRIDLEKFCGFVSAGLILVVLGYFLDVYDYLAVLSLVLVLLVSIEILFHCFTKKQQPMMKNLTYSEYYSVYPAENIGTISLFLFYSSGFCNFSLSLFNYFQVSDSQGEFSLFFPISLLIFSVLFNLNKTFPLKHGKSLILTISVSSLLSYILLLVSTHLFLKSSIILLPVHFKSLSILKYLILGKSQSHCQWSVGLASILGCMCWVLSLTDSFFLLVPLSVLINLAPQALFLTKPITPHPSFLPKQFKCDEVLSESLHPFAVHRSVRESLLNKL